MISKTERNTLSKFLKSRFSQSVLDLLEERGVTNKNGEPMTKGFISHVYNGRNEHLEVEQALWDVYSKRKAEHSKMKAERKELMRKK